MQKEHRPNPESAPTDLEDTIMFEHSKAFSGFAVKDVAEARRFYEGTLGLRVTELSAENGLLSIHIEGSRDVLVYQKPDHTPATYTVLNFPTDDIEGDVDALAAKGVTFERYDGMKMDERGINRGGGPLIAWFTDPSGNILSVLQES
jgi:catechol 2,3-dioxygenase-like lactoylglutathione lyase family enzyme